MVAELLLWPILVVAGFSAILFTVLFVQRFNRALRERWTEQRQNELLPVFHEFIAGDASLDQLVSHVGNSVLVAEQLILNFLHDLTGQGRERLIEAAHRLGLIRRSLRGLKSGSWTKRDLSAMRLGIYAVEDTVSDLERALHDSRAEVRYTAARSLGMIGSPAATDALIDILDHPELLNAPRVLEIVQSMQSQISEPIKILLSSPEHNVEAKLLAIDLAGDLRDYSLVDLLLQVLRSSDKEKVVRSVKALGKIAAPQSVEPILILAQDRQWEVRAQALKAIGLLGIDEGIPMLIDNLSDGSYWVRVNAAEALARFGEKGCDALMAAQANPDSFAKDIARYQLERLGRSTNGDLPPGPSYQPEPERSVKRAWQHMA